MLSKGLVEVLERIQMLQPERFKVTVLKQHKPSFKDQNYSIIGSRLN
jgi:uncharacterized Fe-S radical SAM superfamily protein PflX